MLTLSMFNKKFIYPELVFTKYLLTCYSYHPIGRHFQLVCLISGKPIIILDFVYLYKSVLYLYAWVDKGTSVPPGFILQDITLPVGYHCYYMMLRRRS